MSRRSAKPIPLDPPRPVVPVDLSVLLSSLKTSDKEEDTLEAARREWREYMMESGHLIIGRGMIPIHNIGSNSTDFCIAYLLMNAMTSSFTDKSIPSKNWNFDQATWYPAYIVSFDPADTSLLECKALFECPVVPSDIEDAWQLLAQYEDVLRANFTGPASTAPLKPTAYSLIYTEHHETRPRLKMFERMLGRALSQIEADPKSQYQHQRKGSETRLAGDVEEAGSSGIGDHSVFQVDVAEQQYTAVCTMEIDGAWRNYHYDKERKRWQVLRDDDSIMEFHLVGSHIFGFSQSSRLKSMVAALCGPFADDADDIPKTLPAVDKYGRLMRHQCSGPSLKDFPGKTSSKPSKRSSPSKRSLSLSASVPSNKKQKESAPFPSRGTSSKLAPTPGRRRHAKRDPKNDADAEDTDAIIADSEDEPSLGAPTETIFPPTPGPSTLGDAQSALDDEAVLCRDDELPDPNEAHSREGYSGKLASDAEGDEQYEDVSALGDREGIQKAPQARPARRLRTATPASEAPASSDEDDGGSNEPSSEDEEDEPSRQSKHSRSTRIATPAPGNPAPSESEEDDAEHDGEGEDDEQFQKLRTARTATLWPASQPSSCPSDEGEQDRAHGTRRDVSVTRSAAQGSDTSLPANKPSAHGDTD